MIVKKRYFAVLATLFSIAVITTLATMDYADEVAPVHLSCDRVDLKSESKLRTVITINPKNKTMTWNGGTFDNLIVNEHQYQIRAVPRDQCKSQLSCPDATMIVNRITLVASKDRYKGTQQDRNRRYQCQVTERI